VLNLFDSMAFCSQEQGFLYMLFFLSDNIVPKLFLTLTNIFVSNVGDTLVSITNRLRAGSVNEVQ
jgi:hypothetical protein